MPLSQAARIARMRAEEEKTRAARQASAVPAPDPNRPDPPGAGLPKVAGHPPQGHDPDHGRDRLDPAPARLPKVAPQAQPGAQAVPNAPEVPQDRSLQKPEERPGRAVDPASNPKAEAAVERFKERLDQRQKEPRREPETEQEDDPVAQADVEAASERTDEGTGRGRDPETGRFREGHQKLGGRVAGSKDHFPRNSFRAMNELIAGRVMRTIKDEAGNEVQRSPAEIVAEAILEGMEGKLILRSDEKGVTYANPLHAVKLFHDYMLKSRELALKLRDAKKKDEGTGGGIRIVLPSVPADPLLLS